MILDFFSPMGTAEVMKKETIPFELVRWNSNFIPRFTKMFEYWNIFSAIVFGIKNSAFPRNLSPWAHSRAEKTHPTIQILRLGEVPFKISFLKNAWCHRNQRLTEQYFTQGHGKIIAYSCVFRFLKFSC